MPPLPKRRTSHARQGERRSHLHLETVSPVECPTCHEPVLPHHACRNCGMYKGEQIIPGARNQRRS